MTEKEQLWCFFLRQLYQRDRSLQKFLQTSLCFIPTLGFLAFNTKGFIF